METGSVVGVVGGSGGVGASTFAAVVAVVAAGRGDAVLVDVDAVGGGVDVLLGIEHVPGARWSGLRLGGGVLDPDALVDGLPRWGPVPVLALDGRPPGAAAVRQVLDAASARATVVVDLGRAGGEPRAAALERCDVVVAVAAGQVRELAAARAVVAALPHPRVGLVLRRGPVRPDEAALLTGVPLLGVLAATGVARSLMPGRLPPRAVRVAAGVLDGVADGVTGDVSGNRVTGGAELLARVAPCPS